jgi:hypothetical protein
MKYKYLYKKIITLYVVYKYIFLKYINKNKTNNSPENWRSAMEENLGIFSSLATNVGEGQSCREARDSSTKKKS